MPAAVKAAPRRRVYKPVPAAVVKYIASLRSEAERNYAGKEWRVLTGERETHCTPWDVREGRPARIRARLAELAEGR